MTHNPIVKQGPCGTAQPEIGVTQKGVLSKGVQYRVITPGEKLSLSERWQYRNWQLSVVNVGSHEWTWLPEFDSDDDGRPFRLKIVLRYRIGNPWPVVRESIYDLESALTMGLRGELRSLARQYRLNAHKQVTRRITEAIMDDAAFSTLGLELDKDLVVQVRLSTEDQRFVDELDELERSRETPRQQRFTGELPTGQTSYGFTVDATVHYLLSESSRISTLDDLEQAAKLMWDTNIMKLMRGVCRDYTFQEIKAAQAAVDHKLESQLFSEFGIRVVNVNATLDLNAASREVATFDEAKDLERTRELITQQHEHTLKATDYKFIQDTVLTSHRAALAGMLAGGEQNIQWVVEYLDKQRLDVPIENIGKLREMKVLDMDTAQEAAQTILAGLLNSTSARPNSRHIDDFMDALHERVQVKELETTVDDDNEEPA